MWYVLFVLHQVYEDVVALSVGNDDADTRLLHLRGSGIFRMHAATPEGTLLRLDILGEVAARRHLPDQLSSWIIKAAEIIIGLAALVGMFLVYVFPMIFCAITYK